MSKILVTGVCGFVGSSIATILAENPGAQVIGVDNFMRSGSEVNRMRLKRLGVKVVHGDLRMPTDVAELPRCDWVIEAAAEPSVLAGTVGGTRRLMEHNVLGVVNVLEYCRSHGAGLLLISSSRVYSVRALSSVPLHVSANGYVLDADSPYSSLLPGLSQEGIGPEFSTDAPRSLYGTTKLVAEAMAMEYACAFGFPVWITRCGVMAGAGQFGTAEQGIVSYWINSHLRRRRIAYIGFEGKGHQTRDVLHPRDLSALLCRQMADSRSGGQRIYTAGGGAKNALSLAQLTEWCNHRFSPHCPEIDPVTRLYDAPWIVMNNRDSQRDFGWDVSISVREILEEVAEHAVSNPDWLEVSSR